MSTQTPEYVESYIAALVSKAKVAQKEYERTRTTQHAVDEVIHAIGKAVYDAGEELAREAISETGMGNLAGKMMKVRNVPLKAWNFMKGRPSVGVIDDFSEPGIKVIAKPMGVIGAVMPSTNPLATVVGNSMAALKSRNAIIIAPHPASAKSSSHVTRVIRAALESIGAPADLVQCIEEPSLEMTNEMLRQADVNIATGGAGMVKSVYSAGRPAYGVGQGNCQAIIDADYPDFKAAANACVTNRSADQGVPCTGEQTMIVPESREQEMLDALQEAGAYVITDKATIDRIRSIVFPTPAINRKVVGKSPYELGKLFDIPVPEDARVLVIKNQARGTEDLLCKEILCPIIRITTYKDSDFEDAAAIAIANLEYEGAGHSSSIWSKHEEHINYVANLIPVGRFHIEQPTIGFHNAIVPTVTIGCGSWGNNSLCENLNYHNLMNVTRVTTSLPDATPDVPEDWDDWNMRADWGTKVRY